MKKRMSVFMGFLIAVSISCTAFAVEKDNKNTEEMSVATSSNATFNAAEKDFGEFSAFCLLSETDDYAEIHALGPEMVEIAERLNSFGKLKEKLKLSDINYKKAVKIYMDGADSLFQNAASNPNLLKEYLSTAEYIWELQVDVGKQTVSFTFNIGKGVSDEAAGTLNQEQIDKIEREEGHWKIVRTAWGNEKAVDYKTYIRNGMNQKGISEEGAVVVIGGTPVIRQPLALAYGTDQIIVIPSNLAANRDMKLLMDSKENRRTVNNTLVTYDLTDYLERLEE